MVQILLERILSYFSGADQISVWDDITASKIVTINSECSFFGLGFSGVLFSAVGLEISPEERWA